jgi:DNA-directed RNA polymerase specialized sigma24 family protein
MTETAGLIGSVGLAGPMGSRGAFPGAPTTRWSVVLATRGEGQAAQDALATLCRMYWQPAYSFIHRKRANPETALDITQEFFADVIERKDFAKVAPGGRFRAWLYGALDNALKNDWKYETRKKRDQRNVVWRDGLVPEAAYQLEPRNDVDPARWFDHCCALAMYRGARAALSQKYQGADRAMVFRAAIPESDDETHDYDFIAASLGISPNTLRQKLFRIRVDFRERFYRDVAETVEASAEFWEEIRFVVEAIQRPTE